MARKPEQFEDWPASIDPGFGPYRAVVQRVTDGDSLYALVDLGFNQYAFEAVRIMGIDAPELFTGSPEERGRGRAAKEYLESLCPPGTRCLMRTDKDRTSFGRYVASLTTEHGVDVASEMVRSGHAVFSDW